MTDDLEQLDGVEEALLELDAAEKAGLFRRTHIDTSELTASPVPVDRPGLSRLALRLLPVAAALAMAVGVWTWMSRVETNSTNHPPTAITSLASAGFHSCYGSFHGCLAGPKDGVPPECLAHDYDSDGDVDLADFRAYQVTCASPGQTR